MAVSNIFAPIALYRIRSYQVSDVHEETSSGEYVALRLVTIALSFVLTMLYAVFTCAPSSLPCVALYLLFRAGDVFIDVLHGIDQQHFRMDYCGRSMAARAALFLAAFSIVMALTDSLELSILAMVLVTYPVILYDLRCARQFSSVRPVFSAASIRRLLIACLPAVVGSSDHHPCRRRGKGAHMGPLAEERDMRPEGCPVRCHGHTSRRVHRSVIYSL